MYSKETVPTKYLEVKARSKDGVFKIYKVKVALVDHDY
jgi:hypothetical protein